MNGSVLHSGTFTSPSSFPDTNWRLVGVADFSNPLDGKPDFVWRNQVTGETLIWLMNDASRPGRPRCRPALADTRWKLVATGDYNLDLRNDFVWRHDDVGPERDLVHERRRADRRHVHQPRDVPRRALEDGRAPLKSRRRRRPVIEIHGGAPLSGA